MILVEACLPANGMMPASQSRIFFRLDGTLSDALRKKKAT
jgi:hypothetical protein